MTDRHDQVVRAAVGLFAQRGYAATGIRELGRAAGLTSATLYHYVGTKEDLLVAIMRSCLDELTTAAGRAVASSTDARVQLGRLLHAHVGLSATSPLTARVTDQELRHLGPRHRGELLAMRDGYEALLGDVLERGRRAGQFDLDDPRLARLALLEMCNGVAHWYHPDGRLSVAEVQDRFVGLGGRLVAMTALRDDELGPTSPPVRLASEPITHLEPAQGA